MILAISTNKGGVLKTSITVNLAGVLSSRKKRVLLIDTDNQGNVSLSFGVNPDQCSMTVYDTLVKNADPRQAIIKTDKYIDVLPSNDEMSFFEFDVLPRMSDYPKPFNLLRAAIQSLRNDYDYILIDTPPNLGLTQANALTAADAVIIPLQPESYAMRSLIKTLAAISDFAEQHNPALRVAGVVATKVNRQTVLHNEVLQQCRAFCAEHGVKMFETVIPNSIKFAESIAYERLPATMHKRYKDHPLVQSYKNLAKELLDNE